MSSISKETASRADPSIAPPPSTQAPIADPGTHDAQLPSEVVQPTRTDSVPQQGSTEPGDGSKLHQHDAGSGSGAGQGGGGQGGKVPFKEQVVGVAKKTRGTVLGQPETKAAGERILSGEATHDSV